MSGKIIDQSGKTVEPKLRVETVGERENKDIISVATLLKAAGVDIDRDSLLFSFSF